MVKGFAQSHKRTGEGALGNEAGFLISKCSPLIAWLLSLASPKANNVFCVLQFNSLTTASQKI